MKNSSVSFIMPVFNAESTLRKSINSIFNGNMQEGDEIVVLDDGSNDGSIEILNSLKRDIKELSIHKHSVNLGGGAARNSAVRASRNDLIFCLDSDNILEPKTVPQLSAFLLERGLDIAAFEEIRYFREDPDKITHRWKYDEKACAFEDYLNQYKVPGASGNYLYTRSSWSRAGGYPEKSGALDAWGFGLRQMATGSICGVLKGTGYRHRYGHNSYWIRQSRNNKFSEVASELLIPYMHLLPPYARKRVFDNKENNWFENMERYPLIPIGVYQNIKCMVMRILY